MVTPDNAPTRSFDDAEGAPPLPPPGGYRGARRVPVDTAPPPGAPPVPPSTPTRQRRRPSALGIIALISGSLLALVLLIMFLAGGTDAIYSLGTLTVQLLVVGVVVAAVVSRRSRRLGVIAVAIVLLLNVGTVGALAALRTSATGNYDGVKTEEQKFWEAFPGLRDTPSSEILAQPSLEDVREYADILLERVREEVTAEYGYQWVQSAPEGQWPQRNGYGGESMLVEYQSATWTTTEPIRGESLKLRVMATIEDVFDEYDWWGMIAFNDPASGVLDETTAEKFYGSADPSLQSEWEWYTDNYPDPMRAYISIFDFSLDTTGDTQATREAIVEPGMPLEGLEIVIVADPLLSDADRQAFEDALEPYPAGS